MPPPERRVVLGVIGAPHGVKGEARLKAFTADPLDIRAYGPLFAGDGRAFEIIAIRPLKDDMLVVRFKGITDRDIVAKLTNTELFVDRDALPAPEDDEEFYHADLIGLAVIGLKGESIGSVIALHDFGAGDVLELRPNQGSGTWLQPFTKAGVPKVEISEKRLVIDPSFLQKPEPPQDPTRKHAPGKASSGRAREKNKPAGPSPKPTP